MKPHKPPKITLSVLTDMLKAMIRPHDRYEDNTRERVWYLEDENEGAVYVGVLKDALYKYRPSWLRDRNAGPQTWFGTITRDDGKLAILLALDQRKERLELHVGVDTN